MIKEPRYRAKPLKRDKTPWVTGHYYMDGGFHYIKPVTESPIQIDPDTLCESTGMFDNDEDEIFEYDIIMESCVVIWKTIHNKNSPYKYGYYGINEGKHPLCTYKHAENNKNFKIAGNIFDNPEIETR